MENAATLAALLLERLNIRGKPDLASIANKIGLRAREVASTGFDGALVRPINQQKGVVLIRESISEATRKRFTLAHEIGHYLLPLHQQRDNVCTTKELESWDPSIAQAEQEANSFAAELLLPTRLVRNALALAEPSIRQIASVAREFEASLTATTRKFVDVAERPSAMLWSENNRTRWCHRNDAFRWWLPLVALPHRDSRAARLFAGESVSEDFVPIPPSLWLEDPHAQAVHTLLESSIALPNYKAVLTILWVQDWHEQASEQDEFLEEFDPSSFTLERKKWPR